MLSGIALAASVLFRLATLFGLPAPLPLLLCGLLTAAFLALHIGRSLSLARAIQRRASEPRLEARGRGAPPSRVPEPRRPALPLTCTVTGPARVTREEQGAWFEIPLSFHAFGDGRLTAARFYLEGSATSEPRPDIRVKEVVSFPALPLGAGRRYRYALTTLVPHHHFGYAPPEAFAWRLDVDAACGDDLGHRIARDLPLELIDARAPRLELRPRAPAEDALCPYCRDHIAAPELRACPRCAAPHHAECFDLHGGCTIPACGGAPERRGAP